MPPPKPPVAAPVPSCGPRWSVVATLREPAILPLVFAAHHLQLGALHVHLYLDGPHPGLRAAIGNDPCITLIDSDTAFYDSLGRKRPSWINRRQIVNANHAETQSAAEWLFHLDADEFLGSDPTPDLAGLPPEITAFWVPNRERVFLHEAPATTIFDGALALPMRNPHRLDRVRGPDMSQLTRHGLLAHDLGKGALRVGAGVGAGIHKPRTNDAAIRAAETVRVSHFDGLTRLHWALKLRRHAQNGIASKPGRKLTAYRDRQIALAAECGGDMGPIFALHDRLRMLPPRIARQMRRMGKLVPTGVDAAAALAQIFPQLDPDLSVSAFDAALVEEYGLTGPGLDRIGA